MNISFDKLLDFIRQWSAGRLAVLVILVAELILKLKDKTFLDPILLFSLISMAILLEVFENALGKIKIEGKGVWLFVFASCLSIGGIIVIAFTILFRYGK
jgi:hypothetical protein